MMTFEVRHAKPGYSKLVGFWVGIYLFASLGTFFPFFLWLSF